MTLGAFENEGGVGIEVALTTTLLSNTFLCSGFHSNQLLTAYLFGDSLKMECEKLAQEKTEMQRHYVMVSTFYALMRVYITRLLSIYAICIYTRVLYTRRRQLNNTRIYE